MLAKCVGLVGRFVRHTSGATAVEYALIAGVIGLGIIAGLDAIRDRLNDVFDNVDAGFDR